MLKELMPLYDARPGLRPTPLKETRDIDMVVMVTEEDL